MRNKEIILRKLFLGILFFSLLGCRDDDFSVCEDKEEVTAKFSIGVKLTLHREELDTLLVSDTVLTFNRVEFSADETYDSYEWNIGDDPRVFSDRKVTLFFETPESNLEIRLIAKRNPNTGCFPDDDGIDTLVRRLTVIERLENPVFGKYFGYLEDSPNDSFQVSIIYSDLWGIQMININEGCNPASKGFVGPDIDFLYKKLFFGNDKGSYYYVDGCQDPVGWLFVAPNNNDVIIEYSTGGGDKYNAFPEIRTYHRFIGKRTN